VPSAKHPAAKNPAAKASAIAIRFVFIVAAARSHKDRAVAQS
jgi:hypothetical protein